MSDAATDQIPEEDLEWIAPPLRHLAVPMDSLRPQNKNPRKGDVDAVAASFKVFGQRKSITARLDGEITAGSHSWLAAKKLGHRYIACAMFDDDDEMAMAWSLTENRTHDLGTYDKMLLAEAIESIHDEKLLAATSYDEAAIEEIMASVRETRNDAIQDDDDDDETEPEGKLRDPGNPVVQYQLIFSNEEHQQAWYQFVRWLKKTYEGDTLSDRLFAFIGEVVPSENE